MYQRVAITHGVHAGHVRASRPMSCSAQSLLQPTMSSAPLMGVDGSGAYCMHAGSSAVDIGWIDCVANRVCGPIADVDF